MRERMRPVRRGAFCRERSLLGGPTTMMLAATHNVSRPTVCHGRHGRIRVSFRIHPPSAKCGRRQGSVMHGSAVISVKQTRVESMMSDRSQINTNNLRIDRHTGCVVLIIVVLESCIARTARVRECEFLVSADIDYESDFHQCSLMESIEEDITRRTCGEEGERRRECLLAVSRGAKYTVDRTPYLPPGACFTRPVRTSSTRHGSRQ